MAVEADKGLVCSHTSERLENLGSQSETLSECRRHSCQASLRPFLPLGKSGTPMQDGAASESEEVGTPVFTVVSCIAAIRVAGTAYE